MELLPRALAIAERVHRGQTRVDGVTSYLTHPLAVAALVLRFGGDEAQAAAALVHDTIGDPRGSHDALTEELGAEPARIAQGFSDPPEPAPPVPGDPWQATRKAYLVKLRTLDERTLLVIACEELHEAQDLLLDVRIRGAAAWKRFPVHAMVVFWYFREILSIANDRLVDTRYRACASELAAAVRQLQPLCNLE